MSKSLLKRLFRGLSSRPFVRLVQAHSLSSAGDALVAVALAGSVFFSEDPQTARSRVALSLLVTMAPFAVVAPFLGPAIDRIRGGRRFILFAAAIARAVLCLAMANVLDQLWLYPLAFASLVLSKTHAVAKSASVPEIVESKEQLVTANSVMALGAVLAGFAGGAIGLVISFIAGADWVVRAGAVVFTVGAVLSLEAVGRGRAVADWEVRAAAEEDRREPSLASVVDAGVVMAVLRMGVGFLAFLIAFDYRRTGAPTWWFGAAVSVSMAGSSIGNFIGPRLRGYVREEWMLTGSCLGVAVIGAIAALGASRLSGLLLAAVVGLSAATGKLAFDSIVQRDAPLAVRGRSFARFEALFQLVWVLGALVPVVLSVSEALGYAVLAVGTAVGGSWYLRASRRRVVGVDVGDVDSLQP